MKKVKSKNSTEHTKLGASITDTRSNCVAKYTQFLVESCTLNSIEQTNNHIDMFTVKQSVHK